MFIIFFRFFFTWWLSFINRFYINCYDQLSYTCWKQHARCTLRQIIRHSHQSSKNVPSRHVKSCYLCFVIFSSELGETTRRGVSQLQEEDELVQCGRCWPSRCLQQQRGDVGRPVQPHLQPFTCCGIGRTPRTHHLVCGEGMIIITGGHIGAQTYTDVGTQTSKHTNMKNGVEKGGKGETIGLNPY